MSNPGNAPAQSNTFAIVSLVLGIIGTFGGIFIAIIGVVAGIVGLVLGILARKRGGSRGMILAGIILSIVAIVVGIIGYIATAVLLNQA
ncbi:hypothetical protein BIV02_06730 [Curtobacterium sp. MMLR14_014]|uniref:DUF4190 domain-containing protein n=1 Tax=unclassified Curtobacterium TaxID=257496 RepID=UPI0008F8A9FC|nr:MULTISPECIES: DUF4190 domain-containing protein [unclassified Curtobacterium]OII40399.1 hypothetical protein BIU91_00755 [Curtobacterium sp. MMLR14_002]OII41752.1 hypothetical protein BIV02_06730 [Curtobacterium sp. MMLR14_014]